MTFDERCILQDKFNELIKSTLTETSCKNILEMIAQVSDDNEVAHSMEDVFRAAVLREIDHPLAKLALKTSDIEFSRWCG